jgi:hypothetical protein
MSSIKGNHIYIYPYVPINTDIIFIAIVQYNTVIYKNNVVIILNEKQVN